MPPASSEASVDEIRAFFAAKKMKVPTVFGYSGAGWKDPAAMRATAARVLDELTAAHEKDARAGQPRPTDFGGSAARIFP